MENKQDKGFTLVELLIVIVILGILATITVFAVRGITDQGQTSACNADEKTLQVIGCGDRLDLLSQPVQGIPMEASQETPVTPLRVPIAAAGTREVPPQGKTFRFQGDEGQHDVLLSSAQGASQARSRNRPQRFQPTPHKLPEGLFLAPCRFSLAVWNMYRRFGLDGGEGSFKQG